MLTHAPISNLLQSIKAAGGGGLAPPGLVGQNPSLNAIAAAPFADSAWLAAAGPMAGPVGVSSSRSHGVQGCSIYIKGMPEDADKLWLYEKFSRFGGILSVRVLLDEHTGRCNGIGFVNFTDPEGARAAHETMNGVSMGERLLHVMVQSHGGGGGRGPRQGPGNIMSGPGGPMPAGGLQGGTPFMSTGVNSGLQQQGGDYMGQNSW